MISPTTDTLKVLIEFAQLVKRSHPQIIRRSNPIEVLGGDRAILLDTLKWCHPSGDRITPESRLFVCAKPLNCDRAGLSQTCYYAQANPAEQLHPLWFSDCRKSVRTARLGLGPLPDLEGDGTLKTERRSPFCTETIALQSTK